MAEAGDASAPKPHLSQRWRSIRSARLRISSSGSVHRATSGDSAVQGPTRPPLQRGGGGRGGWRRGKMMNTKSCSRRPQRSAAKHGNYCKILSYQQRRA